MTIKSFNFETGEVTTREFTSDDAVPSRTISYIQKRKFAYPSIGDQLDDLYKKGAFSDEMAAKIKKVKDDNPKS
tara:strand:+ start:575 stop:796 length:222 start_codon:yes stop_codon:yes gene_type:complete